MHVNSHAQAYGVNQIRNNNSYPTTEVSNVTTAKTETDTVAISNAGRNAEEKWQTIANKYDVTNMSQSEVATMTEELYENKLIPQDVLLHMIAPASMNQDPDQKYNVLSRMRDSLEFSKNRGSNPEQLEIQKRVVEIFERLKGLLSNDPKS